jgi:hypothetical protein
MTWMDVLGKLQRANPDSSLKDKMRLGAPISGEEKRGSLADASEIEGGKESGRGGVGDLEKTRGRRLRKGGCSGLQRDSAQLGRCRKQSLLAGAVTLYRSVPVNNQCGRAKNTYVARGCVQASKGQVTTDRPTECTGAWGMQVLLLGEIECLSGGSFAPV